jgi:transposase
MQRKHYNAEFKAKVALESLREDRTLAELSSAYGVHSAMINRWRKQLLERAHLTFSCSASDGIGIFLRTR